MKHIAFDVSGNFHEGKGTTGICISEDGEINELKEIKASDFTSMELYWLAHSEFILEEGPDHVTFEGYKLYNHKGKEAKIQANSQLETPQMLGALRLHCFQFGIPYNLQFASEIKNRWREEVLVRLGLLTEKGGRFYWNGESTNLHKRDALKHALHFWKYTKEKIYQ
jgi:hypothetical protein